MLVFLVVVICVSLSACLEFNYQSLIGDEIALDIFSNHIIMY